MLIRTSMIVALLGPLAACTTAPREQAGTPEETQAVSSPNDSEPPPRIRAWMDRLTVDHEYDPETGFIVAREVIGLPDVIDTGIAADKAIERGEAESRLVIVVATADRCAPCQQYKKSALNDSRVVERLGESAILATHVEVDRQPELAQATLGSLAIPMTYAFRNGERVGVLRGQKSAEDLLAWLDGI